MPGVALTPEQLARARAAFDAPPPKLDMAPWCFEPHHGIVLYDDAERPVAAIDVCFECERQGAGPAIPGKHDFKPVTLETLAAYRTLFCDELHLLPCDR